MTARAGVVVTGTEVLTGRVSDQNGPWLAEQLRIAGVDIATVIVVGDRAHDMRQALGFLAGSGVDLIITSGGLGPTADDLTASIVADFQGRSASVDEALAARIAAIVERLSRGGGWQMDPAATAFATRKQALVPVGATVLEPVGTAPGLIVAVADGRSGPPVLVLPGPPRELQPMWAVAVESPLVQAALSGRAELLQRTIRLWGTPESELAATMRAHEDRLAQLEITTCLREGELEIVTRYAPSAQSAYDEFHNAVAAAHGRSMFSPDGATIDEIVARALLDSDRTIATAESCTAGLLAGRLTDLAGSSAYVRGGLIVYANQAKRALADVPAQLLDSVGAVSAEVADALAAAARVKLGADVGVGITGIAGPGGGSPDKPVGLVYLCAATAQDSIARRVVLPGSRDDVRKRTVVIALHMLRELLSRQ